MTAVIIHNMIAECRRDWYTIQHSNFSKNSVSQSIFIDEEGNPKEL